jgi:hypothetical protein
VELNSEGFRPLTLRRDDVCSRCGAVLVAGTRALWNSSKRLVICTKSHTENVMSPDRNVGEVNEDESTPDQVTYDKGKAGGSAMAKHDHLVQAREERVMARVPRFPKVGKLLLAVYDEPQSTKVWETGAEGEIAIGRLLDSLAEKYGFLVIHDRLIPKSKANIDHIAITKSGVIVIDAKNYQGTVQVKDQSGFFSAPDPQLWVGRRNCMKLVTGMKHQVDVVKATLSKNEIDAPVVGVLAFYAASWSTYKFMRVQEEIEGVLINSKGIEPIVARPGDLSAEQIDHVTRVLALQLKSAV